MKHLRIMGQLTDAHCEGSGDCSEIVKALNYFVDIEKTEWRLIALNTQFYLAPSGLEWLKSAVNTTKRVIIFNHMPLDGSSNDLGNNVEIRRILP